MKPLSVPSLARLSHSRSVRRIWIVGGCSIEIELNAKRGWHAMCWTAADRFNSPAALRGTWPWTVAPVEEVELATLGWVHWHNTQLRRAASMTSRLPSSRLPTLPNKPTTDELESNRDSSDPGRLTPPGPFRCAPTREPCSSPRLGTSAARPWRGDDYRNRPIGPWRRIRNGPTVLRRTTRRIPPNAIWEASCGGSKIWAVVHARARRGS